MRTRWLVALGVAVLGVGVARAQPLPPAASPPILVREPPCDLPPLLPVPQPNPPLAEVPRPGPSGVEYDHGYSYLPERLPERRARADVCGPPGGLWVALSLELAWVPTHPAPATVRLRVADPTQPGRTLAGPLVPVGGRSAGRFEAALGLVGGWWFDESHTRGIEASFFTRDATTTFGGFSNGALVLFPRGTGRAAQVIAFPDGLAPFVAGTFPTTLGTFFTTVDVNYRHKLLCSELGRLDVLAGYRYAFLSDELYLGDVPDDGRDDYRRNRVAVSNSFHGGQIGLAGEVRADGWFVAGSAKVAFGATTVETRATGAFALAEARAGGGFRRLAALGAPDQSRFAVMPTFNVQVGRQVTEHARVFAGYSFQYLNRVARLGDTLNPTNPGPTYTDFWVQSISLGAELRF